MAPASCQAPTHRFGTKLMEASPIRIRPITSKSSIPPVEKNEGEGFVLAPYAELSAPVLGIMSVREAHGTIAAAELAGSICQGKKKVEEALDDPMQRKTVVDTTDSPATGTNVASEAPHFSHLAMCEKSINPPLGWVLSKRTRSRFADILKDCENARELAALEKALGLPALAPASARR
jgi:hypothetical protein